MTYTSLHNHTYYSTLDGFPSPEEYLQRATELGLKGIAITEHGNVYSWLYFHKLKEKYPDVKILYGIEFYEAFDMDIQDKDNKYFHLVAIARNERGRVAINKMVTESNFRGFYYKPRVDLEMMKEYANDIIVTSACLASKLSRAEDLETTIKFAKEYADIFPYFYLEMQSHRHEDQIEYNKRLLEVYLYTGIPFIITTDSHATTEEDLKYQNKLVQIARDDETLEEIYEGCYVQSVEEIFEIMTGQIGYDNVQQGLKETNKVLDLIEDVEMPFQKPVLPHYPLPEGFDTNEEFLNHLVQVGWEKRHFDYDDTWEEYKNRVDYEFNVITEMGFAGYFLIVWDIINWSKENGVFVGAGRGSAGGSLICYLLGITELDPIKHKLIFERFLNPERVSMPDIDIDFSDRDRVVEYLTQKYGEERVCQIINYSYITPVVAIKDTARILKVPYKVAEEITKRLSVELFHDSSKDVYNFTDIASQYPQYKELFEIANKMQGRVRNVSTHAGGVGIVDTEINQFMPMKLGAKGEHVIQADKKLTEEIGIIKFDILGVSTLQVIQDVIGEAGIDEWEISPNNHEFLNNPGMWEVLQNSRTDGVFQVESQGMKELLERIKPTSLDEVSAILALYRPDSMDMLQDYIFNRENPTGWVSWHPDVDHIVAPTYGTIIFQEQLMEIVRVLGGRSMGGADKFRKAIGKKDNKLVRREAEKLRKEIIANGYDEDLAKMVAEYMEEKGGYMFNSSHSALYSVITLQTAYLKANYTQYFFKALLNQNIGDFGSISKYIVDARNFGVNILPPNINKSQMGFTVVDDDIVFGISAIKGIGDKLTEVILSDRETNGIFKNMLDFIERVNPNVSQVVALIKAGAIPTDNKKEYLERYGTGLYKARTYKDVVTLPTKKVLAEKWDLSFPKETPKEEKLKVYNERKYNVHVLEEKKRFKKHMETFREKYMQDELLWEFETLSIFLGENPFEEANQYIRNYTEVSDNAKCILVGVIADITKRKDKHGKPFAFISLYTSTNEMIDITFWYSTYKIYQNELVKGNAIAVLCVKTEDNRFIVDKMKTYENWINKHRKK